MAIDSKWKYQYSDIVVDLAGNQRRSLLMECCLKDNKKGEAAFFDMDQEDDDATATAMSANGGKYRMGATDANSLTLAEINAISTPHMDIIKNRTKCDPYLLEFGHTFRNIDEIAENANHNSRVLTKGMRRIAKQDDLRIFDALTKQAENRGKTGGSSETFPAGQQFDITTGLALSDLTNIVQLFEDNYADDEPLYAIISPTTKKYLIDNSGGTIHSKDFVDSSNFFQKGQLPEIYGIHLIVHPGVTTYKDTITTGLTTPSDALVAFQKSSIMYNTFDGIQTRMAEDPNERFQIKLYIDKHIGTCRMDDSRVVQAVIGV